MTECSPPLGCHSERSEEPLDFGGIRITQVLRFAQDDKPVLDTDYSLPVLLAAFDLPPELNRYTRSCGHVCSGGGGLLAGDAAANGIEFQANILGGFHGTAYRLAYK